MSLPVDVRAIQPLRDVHAAYGRFAEDVRNALAATEMEITRIVSWLTQERRMYWQAEIHRCRDQLAQAKSELFRKRTSQMFGNEANLSEPREHVRDMTRRLERAEKMLERVRKWVGPLQHAIQQYRAAVQPLSDALESDVRHTLARLDRMIAALEQYAAELAPPLQPPPPAASTKSTSTPES